MPIIAINSMGTGMQVIKDHPTVAVISQQQNNISDLLAFSSEKDIKEALRVSRAEKIDFYFRERDLPLAGFGTEMVLAAERYDIDWRIIPAIAMRESTGGKFKCQSKPNNPFGWYSCKAGFKTMDEAIDTIAKNISGNNPNTERYYKDKTLVDILDTYNGRVVKDYAEDVIRIMNNIGEK
jgi:hypothetical protein